MTRLKSRPPSLSAPGCGLPSASSPHFAPPSAAASQALVTLLAADLYPSPVWRATVDQFLASRLAAEEPRAALNAVLEKVWISCHTLKTLFISKFCFRLR